MMTLDYPAIKYYVGTARQVVNLRKNLVRKGIAFPDRIEDITLDFRNGSLYALAVKKGDDEFPMIWKKGECYIVDTIDVAYLLMGEVEKMTGLKRELEVLYDVANGFPAMKTLRKIQKKNRKQGVAV